MYGIPGTDHAPLEAPKKQSAVGAVIFLVACPFIALGLMALISWWF